MSLWTPDGDHPVPPSGGAAPPAGPPDDGDLSPDEQAQLAAMQAEMEQVRQQLLQAPASVVVANHAMGIYELAAIHLMSDEPKLVEASLAVDALAARWRGWRAASVSPRPPSGRRWRSSGPPTSRCAVAPGATRGARRRSIRHTR